MKRCKQIIILTYHSQFNAGNSYSTNDHEGFREDLNVLREQGYRVIRALDMVKALQVRDFSRFPERCAVITLDDGPVLDFEDDRSGRPGERRSMLNLAKRHHAKLLGFRIGRPPIVFTSFVIASPDARMEIAGAGDPYLSQDWWRAAQECGYIDIGTHSWNHVHPAVVEVQRQGLYAESFHTMCDAAEVQKQIGQATRYVLRITNHEAARLFAYPYGQRSDFMVQEYLPNQSDVIAAFTIDGEPVHEQTSQWEIPRFVFNHHWKSIDDLRHLLRQ